MVVDGRMLILEAWRISWLSCWLADGLADGGRRWRAGEGATGTTGVEAKRSGDGSGLCRKAQTCYSMKSQYPPLSDWGVEASHFANAGVGTVGASHIAHRGAGQGGGMSQCLRCWPSVRPSVRPTVHPSIRPTIRPFVRLSDRPSVRPSVRPTVRPSIRPSDWLSVRPSVRLLIDPWIY